MFKIHLLLLVCLVASTASAQFITVPLEYAPNRQSNATQNKNRRVASAPYTDTLSLPFFEDFTAPNASIDSIYFLGDKSIEIHTLGHHGLKDGDQLYFLLQEDEAQYLNRTFFAKQTGKSSFLLYTDALLSNLFQYSTVPNIRFHGYWRKSGAAFIGPNPDMTKWVDSGGVYVNNTLCINPPSVYVASFDGLNADGNPYFTSIAKGKIDYLTSLPIDLSGLSATDNVVLSFEWQGQGHGYRPYADPKNSLSLLFKDNSGTWRSIWQRDGAILEPDIEPDKFYRKFIQILDPTFFHPAFQFKFQAVGYGNGVADNWNLDYIYLDKNRDTLGYNPDRTISNSQGSILKNYYSMPYSQFKGHEANELQDSVGLTVKNQYNFISIFEFDSVKTHMTASNGKIEYHKIPSDHILYPFATLNLKWGVDKNFFDSPEDSLSVTYTVNIKSSDPDKLKGVDFTPNNTDSSTTVLNDYFSYDDGSAEKAGSGLGGKLLVEYKLNNFPDTLRYIDIYIAKNFDYLDAYHKTVTLLVADSGKNTIKSISFNPDYVHASINKFFRVSADQLVGDVHTGGVPIKWNKFYVGISIPTTLSGSAVSIPIGLDFTTPHKGRAFAKAAGSIKWIENTEGNYMIRAGFGAVRPITGLFEGTSPSLSCAVFPNPFSSTFTITGDVENVRLYDISGRLVLEKNFSMAADVKIINGSELENGMYLLQLENSKNMRAVKKLLLQK